MQCFRQLWIPVLFCGVIFCSVPGHATPIKPNLKKLLAQPAPKKPAYIPARAGWDGPEQRTPEPNLYTQRYAPQASARAMKASLLAAAIPDWRAVLGVVLVIFLLRRLRRASPAETPASHQQPQADVPRAA
jgi:hypothetical protein